MAYDFKKAAFAAKKATGKFKPEDEQEGGSPFGGAKPGFGGGNPMANLKEKMTGEDKEEGGEKEHEEGEEKIISDLADKFESAKALVEKSDDEELKTLFNEMNELIDKLETEEKHEEE